MEVGFQPGTQALALLEAVAGYVARQREVIDVKVAVARLAAGAERGVLVAQPGGNKEVGVRRSRSGAAGHGDVTGQAAGRTQLARDDAAKVRLAEDAEGQLVAA